MLTAAEANSRRRSCSWLTRHRGQDALAGCRLERMRYAVWVVVVLAAAASARRARGRRRPAGRRRGRRPAQRIVSIVPAVTEMLFAIGAGPKVVAVSSFDTWPPEVASLPKVGALLDPDIEQIIRLRPDLVIVYGTESELRTKLGRAGIRTFPYVMGGLANLTKTMRDLGREVGMTAEAEQAAAAIEARLDAIRQRVAGRPRPRTLLVFGREPGALRAIDASGGIGFLSDIVELGGRRERLRAR